MGLPHKFKDFDTFVNGISWAGVAKEVTRPKLTRKLEDYRGAGMDGNVKIDMGQEDMELEVKLGGFLQQIYELYGTPTVGGVHIVFKGAAQDDSNDEWKAVELEMRGRPNEIDGGNTKAGDDTEETTKFNLVYYKLVVNSKVIIEIDILNRIFVVNGVDLRANLRAMLA